MAHHSSKRNSVNVKVCKISFSILRKSGFCLKENSGVKFRDQFFSFYAMHFRMSFFKNHELCC